MESMEIKIKTRQEHKTHTDSSKEFYKGNIYYKNENVYIIYKEDETTNQIKITKDNSVTIRRMGEARAKLEFEEDEPYTTFYNTDYGSLELTFKPAKVICGGDDCEYNIKLEYDIYSGEEKLSTNTYSLLARSID